MKDQQVTITGIAQNGKAAALVKAPEGIYYIDGLATWPLEMINQSVTVTGVMKEIPAGDLQNEQGEWSSGIPDKIRIVQSARWKKVSSRDQ